MWLGGLGEGGRRLEWRGGTSLEKGTYFLGLGVLTFNPYFDWSLVEHVVTACEKRHPPFCVVVHQDLPEQNQESWAKLIFRSIINIDFSVAITSLSGTIR